MSLSIPLSGLPSPLEPPGLIDWDVATAAHAANVAFEQAQFNAKAQLNRRVTGNQPTAGCSTEAHGTATKAADVAAGDEGEVEGLRPTWCHPTWW